MSGVIYVIDDDITELILWEKYILEFTDYFCCTFQDFDSFCDGFNALVPDIAIIDFVMPVNGLDVCQWLKDNYPDVKRIVNTGMDGGEYKILAEKYGAQFLSKSMSIPERYEAINGSQS